MDNINEDISISWIKGSMDLTVGTLRWVGGWV